MRYSFPDNPNWMPDFDAKYEQKVCVYAGIMCNQIVDDNLRN